eukprot:TRINITY_DN4474_c0_g2_i1.p1 TRINITY_DN4474_c0_g2~~TRINITY_DN4474_c0_g2_i1.p1  ORF type:complete len:631 (-),score=159.96 TRINITY_DN4474_c0_g2_i1:38-1648(-)
MSHREDSSGGNVLESQKIIKRLEVDLIEERKNFKVRLEEERRALQDKLDEYQRNQDRMIEWMKEEKQVREMTTSKLQHEFDNLHSTLVDTTKDRDKLKDKIAKLESKIEHLTEHNEKKGDDKHIEALLVELTALVKKNSVNSNQEVIDKKLSKIYQAIRRWSTEYGVDVKEKLAEIEKKFAPFTPTKSTISTNTNNVDNLVTQSIPIAFEQNDTPPEKITANTSPIRERPNFKPSSPINIESLNTINQQQQQQQQSDDSSSSFVPHSLDLIQRINALEKLVDSNPTSNSTHYSPIFPDSSVDYPPSEPPKTDSSFLTEDISIINGNGNSTKSYTSQTPSNVQKKPKPQPTELNNSKPTSRTGNRASLGNKEKARASSKEKTVQRKTEEETKGAPWDRHLRQLIESNNIGFTIKLAITSKEGQIWGQSPNFHLSNTDIHTITTAFFTRPPTLTIMGCVFRVTKAMNEGVDVMFGRGRGMGVGDDKNIVGGMGEVEVVLFKTNTAIFIGWAPCHGAYDQMYKFIRHHLMSTALKGILW